MLRGWGFDVRVAPEVAEGRSSELPWLAGADRPRARALQAALTDPEVRAVWAARGGVGTHRVLDLLDWTAAGAAGPRLLVGFSDLTALHAALAARLGVATLHGPVVTQLGDGDPAAAETTRAVVSDGASTVLQGVGLLPGVAEGVVVGGNLTVLAAGVGTPSTLAAAGAVALLEDVDEPPYRLDRALTQLLRSGWFDEVRGVALGQFTRCGDPDLVRLLLRRRLEPLGVPVVEGLPVGHEPRNMPVPLGVPGRLDAGAGTLTVAPLVQ